jgi:hypothetical protein
MKNTSEKHSFLHQIKEIYHNLGWVPLLLGTLLAFGLFGAYAVQPNRSFERATDNIVERPQLDGHLFDALLSSGQELPGARVEGLFLKNPVTSVILQHETAPDLLLEFDSQGNYYRLRPSDDSESEWRYYRLPGIGRSLQHQTDIR